MPLIDKADKAKVEFQDLYKYVMDQGGFSSNPDKKFELDSNITGNILDNGPVLLNLIDWLDKNKKDDATGLLLLRKLNRYLYLEFRHFVGQLKANKKHEGKLLGLLHDFYKFKVPAKVGTVEEKLRFSYPFQAALSKAMLFILIVNGSCLSYNEKIENIAYYLDKIRRELIAIKDCHESCGLNTEDIKNFIELLQTYATKEPFIGPKGMKRILITVAVIAVVVLAVWFVYKKLIEPRWDAFKEKATDAATKAKDTTITEVQKVVKSSGGLILEGMFEKLNEQETKDKMNDVVVAVKPLAESLGKSLTKGALEQLGSEAGQVEVGKCTKDLKDKGVVFVAESLNKIHESGATILNYPIVPNHVDIPDSTKPATTTTTQVSPERTGAQTNEPQQTTEEGLLSRLLSNLPNIMSNDQSY
jgi:hypothetical protein